MKRSVIISIGVTIIILILGVWVYLLVYGAPDKPQDVFGNLGLGSEPTQEIRVIDPQTIVKEDETKIAISNGNLQQITTRAVAGFAFASSSANMVRYMERGTGHIFEIDAQKGIETQVSLTTIPQAVEAVFAPNTKTVAVTTYAGYNREVSVGTIDAQKQVLSLAKLPQNADNLSFKNNTSLYFTVESDGTTKGYSYDTVSLAQAELFSLQLTDLKMHWGNGLTKMYVQTKPSQHLEGYLYTITNGVLTPMPQKGYGFDAFLNNTYIIASRVTDGKYLAEAFGNDTTTQQSIPMFGEKCAFSVTEKDGMWCAAPLSEANKSYLEDWYKGIFTSQDYLWHTTLGSQSATLVGDLPKLAGRTLDVYALDISTDGSLLLFSNKTDQTLWLYRTTP